jgi:hypothetical protein
MATISKKIVRNGKFPPVTSRLVVAYIINGLTTGDDPNKTFIQNEKNFLQQLTV